MQIELKLTTLLRLFCFLKTLCKKMLYFKQNKIPNLSNLLYVRLCYLVYWSFPLEDKVSKMNQIPFVLQRERESWDFCLKIQFGISLKRQEQEQEQQQEQIQFWTLSGRRRRTATDICLKSNSDAASAAASEDEMVWNGQLHNIRKLSNLGFFFSMFETQYVLFASGR